MEEWKILSLIINSTVQSEIEPTFWPISILRQMSSVERMDQHRL